MNFIAFSNPPMISDESNMLPTQTIEPRDIEVSQASLQLQCPECCAKFKPQLVNLDMAIAQCPECTAAFRFTNQLDVKPRLQGAFGTLAVPKPDTIESYDGGDKFVLQRRWANAYTGLWVGTTFLLNAAWILCVTLSLLNGCDALILFFAPFSIVGLIHAYVTATKLFNRTQIFIADEVLSITHGPLPWGRTRHLSLNSVSQFFTLAEVHPEGEVRCQTTFALYANLTDGESVLVLRGLADSLEGMYIEQEIETFMAIPNDYVPGEYHPANA